MKYRNVCFFKVMSLFLSVLFLGLMSASFAHAEGYSLVKEWGSKGSGDGQFGYAPIATVDSLGNVYVADHYNGRIEKFDSNGNFITEWNYLNPTRIAVDSHGNVYTANATGSGMHVPVLNKYDSNGNNLANWVVGQIGGIAVDSSDNVFVSNIQNNSITKFDSNGNIITKWGSKGSGNGQFSEPWGIAVDPSDNVYVADYTNSRIQKFDNKGNFITAWSTQYLQSDSITVNLQPSGVTVDSSGNVYVFSTDYNTIRKFDRDGKFITSWTPYVSNASDYNIPFSIAVDSSGNLYVADSGNEHSYIDVFALNNSTDNISVTGNVAQTTENTQSLDQNGTGANVGQTPEQTQTQNTSGSGSKKSPGFAVALGIVGLLAVFLYKKK